MRALWSSLVGWAGRRRPAPPERRDEAAATSRAPSAGGRDLAACWVEHNVPPAAANASSTVLRVLVENAGRCAWHVGGLDGAAVTLELFINGRHAGSGRLPRERVHPGERAGFAIPAHFSRRRRRSWIRFVLTAREAGASEATELARQDLVVRLRRARPAPDRPLQASSSRHNPFSFTPSQGIPRGRDGFSYPLFAERASGCTVTDVAGREFLDVHMGWGCCLLGYSEPRIQAAISREAGRCGALVSLPHRLEIEVSEELCTRFPFGDQVLFGKNGSDVTTWAVRTARVATGRKTVLFAGYHGWQDWYVATQGFDATGVPSGNNPHNVLLPYRDVGALERALALHRGDVAAVMTDPVHTDVDLDDPHHHRDGPYLKKAAELARGEGALFILDEIMTGFRFRSGSAQAAFGLRPDMTCLGKALANGMPLSALVARGDLLGRHCSRIFYAPTMKGEVYSFAAALEALRIYRHDDVPAQVWRTGEEIRREVDGICRRLGLNATLIGAPYRMFLCLGGLPEDEEILTRTLLQQQLTREGVVSYRGFVILSRAHDGRAVDRCVSAFERALRAVRESRSGGMIQVLDTPDVTMERRTPSRLDQVEGA